MKKIWVIVFLITLSRAQAQPDPGKWLRAFPITAYMVDLNDSVKVVQLFLPDGTTIPEKQLGIIYGTYDKSREDAVEKGYGRCQLIKGDYYYFAIGNNKSGISLKAGDLLYTQVESNPIYFGLIPKVGLHFIELTDVKDSVLYNPWIILSRWEEKEEADLLKHMAKDIQTTGQNYLTNAPGSDIRIVKGDYEGQTVFNVMSECQPDQVAGFLEFMIAKPRLYAGKRWKISELFATWLSHGAPAL